ncbi:hypothetical protein CR513_18618, partial [Mucuna pruriens]
MAIIVKDIEVGGVVIIMLVAFMRDYDALSDFAMFLNYFITNSLFDFVTSIVSIIGVGHYNGFMKNCTSSLVLSTFLLMHLHRMCGLS